MDLPCFEGMDSERKNRMQLKFQQLTDSKGTQQMGVGLEN